MAYIPDDALRYWVQDEIDRRVKSSVDRLDGRIDYFSRDLEERFGSVKDFIKIAMELFNEHDARAEHITNHVNIAFRKDRKKLKRLKAKNARCQAELKNALSRIEALEQRASKKQEKEN